LKSGAGTYGSENDPGELLQEKGGVHSAQHRIIKGSRDPVPKDGGVEILETKKHGKDRQSLRGYKKKKRNREGRKGGKYESTGQATENKRDKCEGCKRN